MIYLNRFNYNQCFPQTTAYIGRKINKQNCNMTLVQDMLLRLNTYI